MTALFTTADALPFSCRCGNRRYATEKDARAAEPNGAYKCPDCGTFATDHYCVCDEFSDGRCYNCDTRHGSHGVPPHDPDPFYYAREDKNLCRKCLGPVHVYSPDFDSAEVRHGLGY